MMTNKDINQKTYEDSPETKNQDFRIYVDGELDKSWFVKYKAKQVGGYVGRLAARKATETLFGMLAGIDRLADNELGYADSRSFYGLETEAQPEQSRDQLGRFLGYIASK